MQRLASCGKPLTRFRGIEPGVAQFPVTTPRAGGGASG
ncbi:hypothetical protein BSU04_31220 [Caballeronia sordidicola]|uniref:Uncharacterized protein n=1 Tax=Caballeronia sordidicola TaxID=196367 RepID=A0A226WUN3_CABSO|nr:hypothetical protein BSU04_31220 [Caballeronia sordidicola]